jgi:hypothetical protein
VQVTGINSAGLSSSMASQAISLPIPPHELPGDPSVDLEPGVAAAILIVSCLISTAVGAVAAVFLLRGFLNRKEKQDKVKSQDAKQLNALMVALTSTRDDASRSKDADLLCTAKEFAFVVTDIEESTAISNTDAGAFQQVRNSMLIPLM